MSMAVPCKFVIFVISRHTKYCHIVTEQYQWWHFNQFSNQLLRDYVLSVEQLAKSCIWFCNTPYLSKKQTITIYTTIISVRWNRCKRLGHQYYCDPTEPVWSMTFVCFQSSMSRWNVTQVWVVRRNKYMWMEAWEIIFLSDVLMVDIYSKCGGKIIHPNGLWIHELHTITICWIVIKVSIVNVICIL